MKTTIGKLRIVGLMEGWSFIILLAIAMPLKYYAGIPEVNKVVGMAHGVLFVAYVFLVYMAKTEYEWSWKDTMIAMACSVIPFGTFYADKKIFKKQQVSA
ncbi:DUF3817 domain-containing protein [Aureibacter tunicatorum]|uniref:Integral membrane protein n=1 Tax=Aureibacter tunicatorum TaxID=866807 RepID=A0AAE3XQE9_9BACT|nr:DUF3817 domain-containing protein [Aureibacter tunicatorum]MDR6240682.1 integral membrane protein [Aureibacter tunicatorum]BDD06985.1 membrane protein [Aureibacter tunicatorum]